MEGIFEIRERLESFYDKFDTYVISLGKFFAALLTFLQVNAQLGYMERVNSILVVLILALVCSFLPLNAIVLIGAVMAMVHLYAFSLSALIVGGGILVILLLFYFGLVPQESAALVFTGIALAFQIPCLIPLVFGLIATPMAAVGIGIGTIIFYTLRAVTAAQGSVGAGGTAAEETADFIGEISGMIDRVVKEKEMILMLIVLLAVILLVYLIRSMAIKYAWSVAIATGGTTYLVLSVVGGLVLGLPGILIRTVIGTVISVAVAVLLKLFLFHLDYSHTEIVQFEDEDYYYYVKAVPKRKKGREDHGEY